MSLFASLRNAVRWAGFDMGRSDGAAAQAVVMVDPATMQPVSPTNITLTGPITVSNEVEVKNDTGSPIPVSFTSAPTVNVSVPARACVGRQTLSVTTGAVATLTVPAGAVSAMIQADGNTVSMTLDGATAPTATVGLRIDDGVMFYVDTALSGVNLIARTATTNVQVCYFDKA